MKVEQPYPKNPTTPAFWIGINLFSAQEVLCADSKVQTWPRGKLLSVLCRGGSLPQQTFHSLVLSRLKRLSWGWGGEEEQNCRLLVLGHVRLGIWDSYTPIPVYLLRYLTAKREHWQGAFARLIRCLQILKLSQESHDLFPFILARLSFYFL
jgi:hypothetical protein